MIAEILVKVSFLKHTLIKPDAGIVEGDYNTTKLVFDFEEDVSGKRIVFKMSNPAGELILLKDLEDSEILLAGKDEEGYPCSLFSTQGLYPFELVLYGENSKLTSAPGWMTVSKRQVSVLDSVTSTYLPLFDKLLKELGENTIFFRFSRYADGTDFTDSWEDGQQYIGIAAGFEAPKDKSGYNWVVFPKGEQGNTGPAGAYIGAEAPTDGQTLWIDTDEEGDENAPINVVAKPGQVIVIATVDANGKPLTYKAVDLPQIPKIDWNAAEGEAGYIEGRTHYVDKKGVVHKLPNKFIDADWMATKQENIDNSIIIPEQKLTGTTTMWDKRQMDIQPGITYDVHINDVVYPCVAFNEDGICLGNNTSLTKNNLPFCIYWAGGSATGGLFFTNGALGSSVYLKVTGHSWTEYNTMPDEFLPKSVVKSVNGVTPDENGNVEVEGGGADIDVVAEVGQTIVVEEVDADGKPTKWKAAEYQERTHWKEEGNVQVLKYLHMKSEFEDEYGAFAIFLPPSVFNECVEVLPLASIDTIEYDDVEYTNLATFEANEMRFFGNLYFLNSIFGTSFPNTGEPFVLGGNEYGMLLLNMDTEATLHALQIYVNGTKYHRIDKRYQPEIPTIDLTPYYTDDNNTGFVKVTGDDYFEKVYSVLQRSEIVRVVYRTSYGVGMATGLVGSIAGMGNIEVLTPAIKLNATSNSLDISY